MEIFSKPTVIGAKLPADLCLPECQVIVFRADFTAYNIIHFIYLMHM